MTERSKTTPEQPSGLSSQHLDPEFIEIQLLLEGIFRRYGYDFRNYAFASIRRRIWRRIEGENLGSVSSLQERVLRDPECMERLLSDFSVSVSDFYRNPYFFKTLREKVVPLLKTYPFIQEYIALSGLCPNCIFTS